MRLRSSSSAPRDALATVLVFGVVMFGLNSGLQKAIDLGVNPTLCKLVALFLAMLVAGALSFTFFSSLMHRRQTRRMQDVTEREMRHLAEHDSLTGTYNRRGFKVHSTALLEQCLRSGEKAVLVQFDADRFKEVNDVHGHAAGDQVLRAIAGMIAENMPEETLVARLGGDEFAALVPMSCLGDRIEHSDLGLASSVIVSLDDARKRLTVRTSAGYSIFPDDGETVDELIRAADLALLSVKRQGRGNVLQYSRSMTMALRRRVWEIDGIREAIDAGTLVPFYQPLVSARTGRIASLEALARWRHPVLGTLAPHRFDSALQDGCVGPKVTEVMIASVIRDICRLRDAGIAPVPVALNIGEADMRHGDLAGFLQMSLDEARLPYDLITIEVTEHSLTASNREELTPTLERLRSLGASVALDDFGTGTSSITLLKDIPCTSIKIDRSFIRDITANPSDLAITRSLTHLSHDLGISIVAEGVETAAQLSLLQDLGVDRLQGFLFTKPLPFSELSHLLARGGVMAPDMARDRRRSEKKTGVIKLVHSV